MPKSIKIQVIKRATLSKGGPVLFAIVRNESYFLPFFFPHYRSLGVENFLIYDDNSDDATLDFLHAQPDCLVIGSNRNFGDTFGTDANNVPRRLGAYLKESLPEQLFRGRWVLTVDADEFLILPPGCADLVKLTGILDGIGQPYVTAPMVDFYAETLDDRNYSRTVSPFAANPHFDVGPYYVWQGGVVPSRPAGVPGGVHLRLLRMLRERHPEQISLIYGNHPVTIPRSWKVPLLKHGFGITRINDHEISVPPSSDLAAVLAHFKFHPELDAKIERALKEGQYYNRSMQYLFLQAVTQLLGRERLVTGATRRFAGAPSLEQAGFMRGLSSTGV